MNLNCALMLLGLGVVGYAYEDKTFVSSSGKGLGIVSLLDLVESLLGRGIFFKFDDDGGSDILCGHEHNIGKAFARWEFGKDVVIFSGVEVGHEDGALHSCLSIVG